MNRQVDMQDTGYEVTEFDGDDPSWMIELASNPAFDRIPAEKLQLLFARFSPLPVVAGQVILRQGEVGDTYYLIRQGSARVTRLGSDGRLQDLADLGPGQGFGEEALIQGSTRNATVTMLTDGMLMRLAADDFDALLKRPLVHALTAEEAIALLRQGAVLVDVREAAAYARGTLKGAINIPLFDLRAAASGLDRQRTYLLFCADGRKAATAAFLLAQRGFRAHVLMTAVIPKSGRD